MFVILVVDLKTTVNNVSAEHFVPVFVIHLGTIPSEFGQLDRLESLYLWQTQLKGPWLTPPSVLAATCVLGLFYTSAVVGDVLEYFWW